MAVLIHCRETIGFQHARSQSQAKSGLLPEYTLQFAEIQAAAQWSSLLPESLSCPPSIPNPHGS